jgi:hypothetical protein
METHPPPECPVELHETLDCPPQDIQREYFDAERFFAAVAASAGGGAWESPIVLSPVADHDSVEQQHQHSYFLLLPTDQK